MTLNSSHLVSTEPPPLAEKREEGPSFCLYLFAPNSLGCMLLATAPTQLPSRTGLPGVRKHAGGTTTVYNSKSLGNDSPLSQD